VQTKVGMMRGVKTYGEDKQSLGDIFCQRRPLNKGDEIAIG
jgi:hypothetical protein